MKIPISIDDAIKKTKKNKSVRFKIGAIAFDKRMNFLGYGVNRPRFNKSGGGLHAEMDVIHRYGLNIKTIFILRCNNKGNLLPIEPCINCKAIADKLGIKIVSLKEN